MFGREHSHVNATRSRSSPFSRTRLGRDLPVEMFLCSMSIKLMFQESLCDSSSPTSNSETPACQAASIRVLCEME